MDARLFILRYKDSISYEENDTFNEKKLKQPYKKVL